MEENFDLLKLDNQICFPLYAASKGIVARYKPFLDEFGLTYTQYIVLMVLWEEKRCNVTHLGKRVLLDSGTLTPLLKKLEAKGLIKRVRDKKDERNLSITLTQKGEDLKKEAIKIPLSMASCLKLDKEEAVILYKTLHKLMEVFYE